MRTGDKIAGATSPERINNPLQVANLPHKAIFCFCEGQ
jgi:hypothetical protein